MKGRSTFGGGRRSRRIGPPCKKFFDLAFWNEREEHAVEKHERHQRQRGVLVVVVVRAPKNELREQRQTKMGASRSRRTFVSGASRIMKE